MTEFNKLPTLETDSYLKDKLKSQLIKNEIDRLFNSDLPNFNRKLNIQVTNSINKIYLNYIETKSNPIKQAYDYMDKLSKNRNFDWRTLWPDFLK